ncbi:MAG: ATP synthase F1 subunit gamma [Candidatus Zixiibacteriota bacterium]|nr:MAG: ATP synthase F1 subunit gamma [candidate division Zixibacteria bacterium]
MATLREVKKRIRSVQSTRRITKAMEMVAAAKLRRAQMRAEQAKPYALKMDEMLSHLATASSSDIVHPYFEERPRRRETVVVIASDRGLCGSFNANIIRRADQLIADKTDREIELVTIGKRAHDYYKRRSHPIVAHFGDWEGQLNYDRARQVVKLLTSRFLAGDTDEINLVFTRFITTVRHRIVVERYLPIAPPEVTDDVTERTSEYLFEPSAETIYAALMPSYAVTKMVTALTESFASEHAGRMMAMSNATKNAGEMVDALTLEFNKARQAQITKEILEVVSGAEALKG